jgi:hypothetical protein
MSTRAPPGRIDPDAAGPGGRSARHSERRQPAMKIEIKKVETIKATRVHLEPEATGA